ncbi:MAG: sodium ion-translocating decarboxylase subunit beta [Christensenellaceae bacterium]|nr:sodium ion-translocating decarboxylase subunit beta [Christensenellaceae bacterium]
MDIFREAFTSFGWQNLVMIAVGLVLIILAITKEYEPMLLLPIGFGCILVNLPLAAVLGTPENPGFLRVLYNAGITTELFPLLIFIGIGAMIDFSPLLKQPVMIFFGAAAQFGIFAAMLLAICANSIIPGIFSLKEAAAVGIIGAADGPTTIFVGNLFAPKYIGPLSVAAYSYMSLVPIIQPPVIRALTTKKERRIHMDNDFGKPIRRPVLIAFPIIVTLVVGFVAPEGVPLVGALMFGNLIRECGVLKRLSAAAQNELANLVTILLGITIGSSMTGEAFLQWNTLLILLIGLLAFVFDTAGGVLFAKFINLFLKKKINPMIGAAGISAFPMSARVVQKMAQKEDPSNFILMPAIGANVSGQVGSIIAGAVLISLLS